MSLPHKGSLVKVDSPLSCKLTDWAHGNMRGD